MEDKKTKIPKWYWIVAVFVLLWNLMGVGSFYIHTFITDEAMQALPIAEQDLYNSYPLWTKIVFAIAVFGGAIGSIGLVIKKKWAKSAFIISLLVIIPQMIHDLFFTNARDVYGPVSVVMPIMVIVIGVLLVWFSAFGIKKGWLK
ncbi:MAG: hypothetical protein HQ521_01260 [Bacteroidetes bacterium]|nr:hypothetical protein [Bacteroidota bacterium]